MIKYFPTTIVDNFFEEPKEVVKFANKQNFIINKQGFFPGKRTQALHILHEKFFNSVLSKIINLHFDFSTHTVYWENVEMYFQKIKPYSEDKQSLINKGLIHKDGDYPLVGLIYLNEDADLDSGMSIFRPTGKHKEDIAKTERLLEKKQDIYKKENPTSSDLKDLEKLIQDINYGFEETLKVNNVFNRLVSYNGNDFHGANNFMANKEEEKLILVFFIGGIKASGFYPIQRMNNQKINLDDNKKKSRRKKLN